MTFDFKQFDRSLEDFRDAFAEANNIRANGIERYIAMINAIDAAVLLYYGDLPDRDKVAIKVALYKLENTIDLCINKSEDNTVHELKGRK